MKRRTVYIGIGLFLLPLLAAGVYVLAVRAMALFRYDPSYFTPQYQDQYPSPGTVASAIEQALHKDNPAIFAELTGLRRRIRPPQANPNVRLMILWKVTDQGYFQYLFFNTKTYQRIMYNIKQVDGRWVWVPRDLYYFLDSGDWLLFFLPAAALWWSVLVVIAVGVSIYTLAARFREQQYRFPRS
jgi:hypothetical protein